MEKPDKAVVALVRIINGTQHPALRFQCTVLPEAVTDEFIRFGKTPGDELVGWWPLRDVVVDKVLGTPTADGLGYTHE